MKEKIIELLVNKHGLSRNVAKSFYFDYEEEGEIENAKNLNLTIDDIAWRIANDLSLTD